MAVWQSEVQRCVGENLDKSCVEGRGRLPATLRRPEPGAGPLSQEFPVEQLPDHSSPEVRHVSLQRQVRKSVSVSCVM